MKKTHKPRRAEPRSKTPPASFTDDNGDRIVLLVDESFTTAARSVSRSRQPIFLELGAGLEVSVHSRKVNKRRFPLLRIYPAPQVVSKAGISACIPS